MKRQLSMLLAVLLLMLSVSVPVSAAEKTATGHASVSYDDYASVSYDVAVPSALESYLVQELNNFAETIDISKYNISRDDIGEIYFSFLRKHAELFFVPTSFNYQFYQDSSTVISITPEYLYTKPVKIKKQAEFDREVNKAIASASSCKTDFQKALAIHDYIITTAEYDEAELEGNSKTHEESHTAYGVLVNKIGVCQSYTFAYTAIMNKMGIPCYTAQVPSHVWNVIKLGGKWYHIDLTFDDPLSDNIGRVSHKYFLLSDTALKNAGDTTHKNWDSDYTCSSTVYDNYWWKQVNTAFVQYDGYAYYSPNTNTGISRITASSLDVGSTSGQQTIVPITAKWPASAGYWIGAYTRLAYHGGYIYYNTVNNIGRYDLKTGKYGTFYTPTLSAGNSIYGLAERDDYLWYSQKSSPNNTDSLYKVGTKLVSQIPTTEPTTKPSTAPPTTAPTTTKPTTLPPTTTKPTTLPPTTTKPTTLPPTTEAQQPVDFVVSNPSTVLSNITSGTKSKLYVSLRNLSDNSFNGSVTVTFMIDGKVIETVTYTGNLAKGKTATVRTSKEWTPYFGSHTLTVSVNKNKTVSETDFSNNIIKERINVADD